MAVVKKYQLGGKTKESLQDFLSKKLSSTKFTAKGEALARESATNFMKLYNSGNFSDVFTSDPIANTYNVDTNKISDESLKNIDWSGSKDQLNKNIFGQYSGQPDKSNKGELNSEKKKFNTLIASWIHEYNQTNTPESTQPTSAVQVEKDIPEIAKYMIDTKYGGNEDTFTSMFGGIENDEDRKSKILTSLRENVNQYLEDYNKNKDVDKFNNVEKVQNLKATLDSGN